MQTAGLALPPDDQADPPINLSYRNRGVPEETDEEAPVPNLERLVAEAMSLAAAAGGKGPALAELALDADPAASATGQSTGCDHGR